MLPPVIYIVFFLPLTLPLSLPRNALNPLENRLMWSVMNPFISASNPTSLPSTTELIARNGYNPGKYTVVTEDGYILTLNRIIKSQGPPVLLMHGVLGSSEHWMLRDKLSLASLLADAGFDVWLGEQRGSYYSRDHTTYKTSDPRFWNFSVHESAIYDLPAFINFILKTNTNYKKVHYVGHSMGTTVFFILTSVRPQFCDLIEAAFLFSPIAYPPERNGTTPQTIILDNGDAIVKALGTAKQYEFFPRKESTVKFIQTFCPTIAVEWQCLEVVKQLYGENSDNWDKGRIWNYFSYLPSGTSLKTAHHLFQIFRNGTFCQYDYGRKENIAVYGRETPPEYDLSKITTKVVMYYGLNDPLTSVGSTTKLAGRLPNLVKNVAISDPTYSHMDFVFGLNSKSVLYDEVISLMKQYSGV